MLDELENLTDILNARNQTAGKPSVVFGYGTRAELNVLADAHADGFLLFHEGYFQAIPKIIGNGAFQHTHQLTLYFFCPSALSDKPGDKRINKDLLMPLYMDVYRRLDTIGIIATPLADMNFTLNLTDRNLDGIRLKLSLTTEAVAQC